MKHVIVIQLECINKDSKHKELKLLHTPGSGGVIWDAEAFQNVSVLHRPMGWSMAHLDMDLTPVIEAFFGTNVTSKELDVLRDEMATLHTFLEAERRGTRELIRAAMGAARRQRPEEEHERDELSGQPESV